MTKIPINQIIWRVFLKYGKTGPVLTKCDKNRRRVYVQKTRKELRKSTDRYQLLKRFFYEKYITENKGIKAIAKEMGLTYTNTRCLLDFLGIEIRRGRNVVTQRVRDQRKEKAHNEYKDGIGFFNPEIRRKVEKYNARGVQGYFLNESTNELVWLRSTYEYIFAKWLNRTKQKWKMEVTYYKIGNCTYRPDFFIYDASFSKLEKIVEIKGYWDNNSHKAIKLNEKLGNVQVSIIKDIEKFIENDSTYIKQLAEWKQKRITNNG